MGIINSFKFEHRFLSNFYPIPIDIDGLTFLTVENAYQASKTLDIEERKFFLNLSPGKAKRFGNNIQLRPDWELVKIEIMRQLLIKKFSNTGMKRMLQKTYNSYLIEGNYWHDQFWGKCYCYDCKGKGYNILGLLLMSIRDSERKL